MKIYYGENDIKSQPTNHTAKLVSTGTCVCINENHMTVRKSGRTDWSLFYCSAGELEFENSKITEGQVWIYPPDVAQKYTAIFSKKTVYRYIHFSGANIFELFEDLGIETECPLNVKNIVMCNLLEKLSDFWKENTATAELHSESVLLTIFTILAKNPKKNDNHNFLERITDRMEHFFYEEYDPNVYSAMLCVSKSRFDHLFKEAVGISPYTFYTNIRIKNACELLENTDLKINSIANNVGYSDSAYFAQAFRKRMGCSPSEYRKRKGVV